MPRKIDLTGMKFGKLTVIKEEEERSNNGGNIMWLCQCECARFTRVRGCDLKNNHTTSCGECSKNMFCEKDGYMVGVTTKGEELYFDLADFEYVKRYGWYIDAKGYVIGTIDGKKSQRMHRLFSPEAEQVDHINNIKHDNRRENLRPVTNAQNQMNQPKCKKPKSSRYKGVCWYKTSEKWMSRIGINKKSKHLGYYITEEEAALAYNKAASFYFGEYANLNVIQTENRAGMPMRQPIKRN